MVNPPINNDRPDVELRMGLATSGAIALVLYESGVVHEIARLLQSWPPKENDSSAYAEILRETGIRPVVDILTGASAGGINSLLLASCITSNTPFDPFRRIWIEDADIAKLQHTGNGPIRSLLDPDVLRREIVKILKVNAATAANIESRLSGNVASSAPQVDPPDIHIELCRTDLLGHVEKTIDSLGGDIELLSKKNTVRLPTASFHDVTQTNIDWLFAAGQATSSVPGVFPPVEDAGTWYSDGGLLNNQPVDLAVKAVCDKPALQQTYRCVYFIDPDPSGPADFHPPDGSQPNPLSLVAAMPGLGLKGDMWDAVKQIDDYNYRSELYLNLVRNPRNSSSRFHQDLDNALGGLGDDLLQESTAILEAARQVFSAGGPAPVTSHTHPTPNVLCALRTEEFLFGDDRALIKRWKRILASLTDELRPLAECATLAALDAIGDVDLERRALRRRLDQINDDVRSGAYAKMAEGLAYRKALYYARIEEISNYLEAPGAHDGPTSRFWAPTNQLVEDLESKPGLAIEQRLAQWVGEIRAVAASANLPSHKTFAAQSFRGQSPLKSIKLYYRHAAARGARQRGGVAARSATPNITLPSPPYEPIDLIRYVLASMSDLIGKRPIDLIRISPNDADNLDLILGPGGPRPKGLNDLSAAAIKLAGRGLGHFSGFFQQSWRRNDYIWGRLDTAEILLKTIRHYAAQPGVGCSVPNAAFDELLQRSRSEILNDEIGALPPAITNQLNALAPGIDANRVFIGQGLEIAIASAAKGGALDSAEEPAFSENMAYLARAAGREVQEMSQKLHLLRSQPVQALTDAIAKAIGACSAIARILAFVAPRKRWTFSATRPYYVAGAVAWVIAAIAVVVGLFKWLRHS